MQRIRVRSPLPKLYEEDETAWLEEMSRLVAERRFRDLDTKHLSELLSDMAKRDKREVQSRLAVLLTHLLKWEYQARKRSKSWKATILEQRHELADLLESATLLSYPHDVLLKAYRRAVRRAALESGLREGTFPDECPFTVDHVLAEE
jgi:hypothetical protein